MTEHKKINPKDAKPVSNGASLFERANEAFGFDALAPAKAPSNLPKVEKRVRPQTPQATAPKASETTVETVSATAEPASVSERVEVAPRPATTQPAIRLDGGARQAIDRERMREAGLIVPEEAVTGLLEEFRIVKRELLADARAAGSAKSRRIMVCSPHSGEGKTYCTLNLAIALAAERDLEVLLIDADVMKPSVPSVLGLDVDKGLMDAIADPAISAENLIVTTDIENLFVLPAGNGSSRAAEYLASARTGEVLEQLTQGAPNRIVLFDTPPALAASVAAELASHVGQTLLIARADETSQAALEDARQLLSACPDIKLLLNAIQFSPSGRRFGGYGGDGDRS